MISSEKLTHHQCLASLVPNVRQPLNLTAGRLERDNAVIVGHTLVETCSVMFANWCFIIGEAIPNID
jgi:hypothetical protein